MADPISEPRYAAGPVLVRQRLFDLGFGLVLALLFLPLIVAIALILWVQGGQIFYAQTRIGAGGRPFRLWKFRSMGLDAEAALASLLREPRYATQWARHRKLAPDPRVTPLGRALRRYSLDELPQIWNVLRGDMGLVGPRPVPVDEVAAIYGADGPAYFGGRPGLTGLWQTAGRNQLDLMARGQLDRQYVSARCTSGDIAILLRTLPALLRGTGG